MRGIAMKSGIAIFLAAATISASAQLQGLAPGEMFSFDDATGDYIVQYNYVESDGEGTRVGPSRVVTARYEPHSKIDPRVRSAFKGTPSGIEYKYTVRNRVDSKQPLIDLWVEGVTDVKAALPAVRTAAEAASLVSNQSVFRARLNACRDALEQPAEWQGHCVARQAIRIGWRYSAGLTDAASEGLAPGSSASGFRVVSLDLPGISIALLHGNSREWVEGRDPTPGDQDAHEISEALEQKLIEVTAAENDSVTRYVAVPTFAVSEPFNAALLLDAIRIHSGTWAGMGLMAEDVLSEVHARMVDATTASVRGEYKAAKRALQDARQALAHKYGDLDQESADDDLTKSDIPRDGLAAADQLVRHDRRLAARVLIFNLRFVEQRLN